MNEKACGAKLRKKNAYCQNTLVSENGRCRLHGGATPKGFASPHFQDGKHSKYQYLPAGLSSRIEGILSDHIDNLEESINIQKVLESTYLEKLGTTESTEAWIKLRKAVSDYDNASHESNPADKAQGQAKAFGMIRFIVNEGLSQSFLYRDIQGIQESQRKLSETLSKVRKEAQDIYTHEQWNDLLSTLVQVLKNNVKDPKILQAIQQDIYAKSTIKDEEGVH